MICEVSGADRIRSLQKNIQKFHGIHDKKVANSNLFLLGALASWPSWPV